MELKFFCDKEECQKYLIEYHFYTIKSNRYIPMDYFDIYDLDRPYRITDDGKILDYERVCRVCGDPLFNKDGKYSIHRRYCQNHSGYELWSKYNWGEVSKKYAYNIADKNKELIKEKIEHYDNEIYSKHITICEICSKLCLIYDTSYMHRNKSLRVINIHHITPVHKITMKNIHLIWDYSNLMALCEDCHHKQDHQLKTKIDPFINFKKITEFTN